MMGEVERKAGKCCLAPYAPPRKGFLVFAECKDKAVGGLGERET